MSLSQQFFGDTRVVALVVMGGVCEPENIEKRVCPKVSKILEICPPVILEVIKDGRGCPSHNRG
ncbi:hypothetical protein F7734_20290 [Scytonema sp. UIC 10036]|uniref:hypothetical protein n=1 Tax=Scytonema sp. UIC 10036 TaxID=2304196 RepID=UPI0012DA7C4D|nr:hypothetical protein [Scytonema sp. UIC 10036]MUG94587.1 hypothetical protein [Scytonema sp. UIC 10036]